MFSIYLFSSSALALTGYIDLLYGEIILGDGKLA